MFIHKIETTPQTSLSVFCGKQWTVYHHLPGASTDRKRFSYVRWCKQFLHESVFSLWEASLIDDRLWGSSKGDFPHHRISGFCNCQGLQEWLISHVIASLTCHHPRHQQISKQCRQQTDFSDERRPCHHGIPRSRHGHDTFSSAWTRFQASARLTFDIASLFVSLLRWWAAHISAWILMSHKLTFRHLSTPMIAGANPP